MWVWLYIGLNIVLKVDGFANGIFPEACGTMSPQHRSSAVEFFPPQDNTKHPYNISFERGSSPADPITVFLSSTSTTFMGFMMEVRELGNEDISKPIGEFIVLEPELTRLLKCGALDAAAVSHRSNEEKTSIRVQWNNSAEVKEDLVLRATIVQTISVFWERVDKVFPPTTTTEPPTSSTSVTAPSTTDKPTPIPPKFIVVGAGVALMCFDIILKVVKIEIRHIVTVLLTSNPSNRHVSKMSNIICTVICTALEISSLILFCVVESYCVSGFILIALVCVVIVINLIELALLSLPIGPTHELKEIHDIAVDVCCVINLIFTIAALFVGLLGLKRYGENWVAPWLSKVMGAFTAWIFLVIIWVLVFSIYVKPTLKSKKSWNSRHDQREKEKEKLFPTKRIAVAVSVTLIVGTTSFALAIIVGTFTH